MSTLRTVLPLAVALALAGAAATPATAQVVTLDTPSGPVRIAIQEAATLPSDFPDDVPLPDGHALVRVDRNSGGITLTMDVPGEVDEVVDGLAAGMRTSGWQPAQVAAPPVGEARAWEKDARAILAWITPGQPCTRVQLESLPRR